jgi:GntP family gluconate:H+ symporter
MSAPIILLVSMVAVIVLIVWLRVHAFLALLAGGLLVGILSPVIPLDTVAPSVAGHLGRVAGSIAIVIALASIIGECLLESGAAERISRRFLKIAGERRGHVALWGSGYVLSVPVFFDTVFYLLVPLARAMSARTGMAYALYVSAVCVGAASTHVFVPPTPGPLAVGAALNVDLGLLIVVGLLVALPASLAALAFCVMMEKRHPLELRSVIGVSAAELHAMAERPDSELPGFLTALTPIALPVILIASRTAIDAYWPTSSLVPITHMVGDPNVALLLSAVFALWMVARRAGLTLDQVQERTEKGLLSAGTIILITAAGGAYGGMLNQAQIGASLQSFSASWGLPVLWLAFLLASILKIAQGSSTVAMITAASVLQPLYATGTDLPNPVYAVMAIGGGSLVVSWMNDSGFWVVGRMGGFTEKETFRIWTIPAAIVGVTGFVVALLLNAVLPLR